MYYQHLKFNVSKHELIHISLQSIYPPKDSINSTTYCPVTQFTFFQCLICARHYTRGYEECENDGNWTDCGDYFIMHKNIESLCSIPETNIMPHVKYNLQKYKIYPI